MTGMVYLFLMSFPFIAPGVHLGIALTTRKASSSKSGCTLLTTFAPVILPSISTINVTITKEYLIIVIQDNTPLSANFCHFIGIMDVLCQIIHQGSLTAREHGHLLNRVRKDF